MIMNKKIYFGLLSLAVVFGSCSSKSDSPSTAPLAITTSIQTRAVTTAFASGAQMNLFVKTIGNPTATDFKSGVSASYNGTSWGVSPSVEIPEEGKAYVYASFPYAAGNTNASAIPVDVASQTDFLYSGSAVAVSFASPSASLTMKHAMAMLAFNITPQGYTGAGKVTAIKFGGDGFFAAGTMNVESGVITGTTKGEYSLAVNNTIQATGWTSAFPQAFCIPFNSTGKNVMATFTIDGKDYSMYIPTYDIALGMKYIFHLVLTPNGLTALTSDTKTISLNNDTDAVATSTYGQLTLKTSSATISLPQIGGTGLSGIVYWGDNSKDYYKFPLTHTYTTTGEHSIIIETWGGTTLTFSDLENTETIDLTSF
jgi:hypothetical protein